ncbi:hypothetical protein cje89_01955 [Campylobacter jejuni subsp. jejuni LMG 9872]|nr:hypothetical protein cje89_01955 [Campylobacter jejuni subsp. jejuni LMG 9872]
MVTTPNNLVSATLPKEPIQTTRIVLGGSCLALPKPSFDRLSPAFSKKYPCSKSLGLKNG